MPYKFIPNLNHIECIFLLIESTPAQTNETKPNKAKQTKKRMNEKQLQRKMFELRVTKQ